jgi:hypothetical protein
MKHIKLFEDFSKESNIEEMASSDVHYKEIMAMYHSGSFAKKKVGAVVCKNPNATQKQIEDELGISGYEDMIEFIEALGIKESVNEESYKVAGRPVTLIKGKKSNGTDWKVKFQNDEETSLADVLSLIKPFPPITKEGVNESHEDLQNYMFFSNLETIKRKCESILAMDFKAIDELLNAGGHDWAADHITVAKENIDQVENFLVGQFEDDHQEVPVPSPEDKFEPEV